MLTRRLVRSFYSRQRRRGNGEKKVKQKTIDPSNSLRSLVIERNRRSSTDRLHCRRRRRRAFTEQLPNPIGSQVAVKKNKKSTKKQKKRVRQRRTRRFHDDASVMATRSRNVSATLRVENRRFRGGHCRHANHFTIRSSKECITRRFFCFSSVEI